MLILPSYNMSKIQKILQKFNKYRRVIFQKTKTFFIENYLCNLYQKNLCEPGESIGIVAGQSIGEPCTQMTLNTFHFAGKLVSTYNLGIPRLRELLLAASKYPRNPTMSLYFKEEIDFKNYKFIEKRFKKIFFSDIIQNISTYLIKIKTKSKQVIKIRLLPKNRYKHQLCFKTSFLINEFSCVIIMNFTCSSLNAMCIFFCYTHQTIQR